jgi:thymidylate synthase
MNEYSDDNVTVRGGYGPRIRHFDNQIIDYDCREFTAETKTQVDQFRYVVECFKKDINTRRAIITIGDPIKDCFGDNRELKCTKDFPCTRTLQFIKQADSNKLNLIVTMRSNDLIYGASAVNVFNYTFMQEYFAAILGLEVGTYIHIANNMHYYDSHDDLVHRLATLDTADDFGEPISKTFKSLEEFDNMLYMLLKEETKMRQEGLNYKPIDFYDPFFDNWYKVLWKWNLKHSS